MTDKVDEMSAASRCSVANHPATLDGWISTSERVPKEFVSVVVTGAFADDCIYIGQNCGRGWMIQHGRAWSHCWTPSHWMPIPPRPKKAERDQYGIDGPFGTK
jgi:hypothetical protein